MKLKKLQQKFKEIQEEIQTYNDKPNPPGGNNCKPVEDIGSITGNKCNYLNAPNATDIGSITGNKCNFNPPYQSQN